MCLVYSGSRKWIEREEGILEKSIGNFIAQKRKERGLTQKELAGRLNISFQAVSKWEQNMALPGTDILLRLAGELQVFFASTFSSKMQIDFLKVAWGISPVLHFLCRHSFRCRRGAVAGIQSLLVTDM